MPGPDEGLLDRGTLQGRVQDVQRGVEQFVDGMRTPENPNHPTGTALTYLRDFEFRLGSGFDLSFLAIRPYFRGEVGIQFGSSHPEVEVIRRSGQFDVEINRQVQGALNRRLTVQVRDHQIALLGRAATRLATGRAVSGSVDLFRSALATHIAQAYTLNHFEIEAIIPPQISTSRIRGTVSIIFVVARGTWTNNPYQTTLFGIPARMVLTGEVEFKIGISTLGWQWLARFLGTRCGALGAALEMEILSAHLAVGGLVNGVLAAATPALVVTGTPIVTFLATYAWSNIITQAQAAGERRGLLNQFANGYIRRIFYPTQPALWFANHPTGRQREARQAGVQMAERDLRDTIPEVLQQIIYTELDYHHRQQAQISDLIFRLGEELYTRRRSAAHPQQHAG